MYVSPFSKVSGRLRCGRRLWWDRAALAPESRWVSADRLTICASPVPMLPAAPALPLLTEVGTAAAHAHDF